MRRIGMRALILKRKRIFDLYRVFDTILKLNNSCISKARKYSKFEVIRRYGNSTIERSKDSRLSKCFTNLRFQGSSYLEILSPLQFEDLSLCSIVLHLHLHRNYHFLAETALMLQQHRRRLSGS